MLNKKALLCYDCDRNKFKWGDDIKAQWSRCWKTHSLHVSQYKMVKANIANKIQQENCTFGHPFGTWHIANSHSMPACISTSFWTVECIEQNQRSESCSRQGHMLYIIRVFRSWSSPTAKKHYQDLSIRHYFIQAERMNTSCSWKEYKVFWRSRSLLARSGHDDMRRQFVAQQCRQVIQACKLMFGMKS